MTSLAERLDTQLAALLSDWSLLTTLLALLILALVLYPIVYPEEPDTHPLFLARQSAINPVRNKHESAVYRSPEVPPGAPLKSGLNVKEAGAPRWASGRDGDLRDVWREVQRGGTVDAEGREVPSGLIMTVLGKEELIEHEVAELSKEIGILGRHLKESGCVRVAVYLPNNVEFLLAIFACSFYGLTPVLLPYNLPHPKVYELINATAANGLICAAGNLPLEDVAKECQNLRLLTWVVEKTSRHMDWHGVPDFAQTRLTVSVWHDVVESNQDNNAPADLLPSNETGDLPGEVMTISQPASLSSPPEIVSFTQRNIVSAIAALISALPLRQRFSSADLVLPANSFHIPYVLLQTLAALYMHASLAINSVAQPGVDLTLATRSISPTVIIASAETLAEMHRKETAGITSAAQKVGKYSQAQTMSAGRMPTDGLLFRLLAPSSSAAGNKPGTLRLILTAELLGTGTTPPLSSTMLSDLRIFTRARICYALCAARVAGAVSQTHVFDYRRQDGSGYSHFGIPLSSVEVWLVGREEEGKLGGGRPEGEVVVKGPAVSSGGGPGEEEVRLGVRGLFGEDGTLALV